MSTKTRTTDLILSAVVALMLSAPLTMVATAALGLAVELRPVLILCAALSFLLSLAVASKGGLAAALLLGGGALAAVYMNGYRPLDSLRALISDIMRMASTGELMLPDHSTAIALILAVVLTLVIYWLTRMSGGVYPALTLSIIILLGGWFMERQLNGQYVVPVVAALVAMFAKATDERVAYARVLPIALMISLLAFFIAPSNELVFPPLREGAEKVRQLFYDYFMFNEPRTAYSLHGDGYLPLADRLGGPAEPRDEPVMLVETDRQLFLRGSIKRTYTGYSWIDNAGNYRYLFGDITKRGTRDRVFDAGRLTAYQNAPAFVKANAKITMLGSYTSTLFVPHRLSDMAAALDMVAYYNSSGEVFITRGVQYGDGYSITAEVPAADAEALEYLIQEGASAEDDQYRTTYAAYTSLPRGVEDEVFFLTQRIIDGARTPYEKATRIRDYLYQNYTYALDVPYPPANRDFVSYFLLSEKKGYCTYFASAMAVMARMAELPARYIEGYVATPGADGSIRVTGQNAHAWVEIYFNGVGWITFNPTPGMGDMERDASGQPPGGNPPPGEERPEDDLPAEEDQGEGDESLDEDIMPEDGENTPEDEQPQDEQPPEEQPPEDEPPGDEESPEEPPAGEEPPPDENGPRSFAWLLILLIALAVAGIAFAIVYRVRRTDPKNLAALYEKPDEKIMVWYRALLLLLEQLGQSPEPNETPDAFAARVCEANLAPESLRRFAAEVSRSSYARERNADVQFKAANAAYEALRGQLRPVEYVRWVIRRVVYGLGDVHQVP